MIKRRVTVTLSLWTDAEIDVLRDRDRWRRFMLGENPSWCELGREPVVRIDSVGAYVGAGGRPDKAPVIVSKKFTEGDLKVVELGPHGKVTALTPTRHPCCGKPRNRPHEEGCPNKRPPKAKREKVAK